MRRTEPGTHRIVVGLTLFLGCTALLRADSIYYQVDKDGNMRLTNAPDEKGYHAYLTSGSGGPGSASVSGLYADQIRQAAGRYGVDANLVKAVIATESNFNPWAVSAKGARGLMQLMPSTAKRFGVDNVHDPEQNILGGVQYLRYLLDLFGGDLVLALAAYNAGEGVVQNVGRVPNYRETRDYVDRVLARYGRGGSEDGSKPSSARVRPRPKTKIYSSVAPDGTLVFSDGPISKSLEN